jgi:hypothetical protein
MGGRQSTQTGPGSNTLKLAMENLQRGDAVSGGDGDGDLADGYFGGAEAADPAKGLREYESSLSARAKEDVIRRIARALKRAGIEVDPEGDLDEVVRQLVTQIPNPKNGKTFSSDAGAQDKVCRVIADVLNDEFSPGVTKHREKFIDTSLSAAEVCRSVSEWVHSFVAGVNTEFLAVHASVKNALRRVEILNEIMKQMHATIKSKIAESNDPALDRETQPISEVYDRAERERNRVEEIVKNILHIQLAPAHRELEIAMRDESEDHAVIKRLGLKPGTSEFADTLAMAISGLGTAASIAARVHKALKKVGVTVRQYLDSTEYADFRAMLDEKLESGQVKADDLAKFLEAMKTLHESFSQKDNSKFREVLEGLSTTGGRRRRHGGDALDPDEDTKTSVEQRVNRRETEKKVILRDFAGRMARHYNEMFLAVKDLAPKFGREIPMTDKSDALNDALKRLGEMRNESERIELALLGLYMEASDRERKDRFVNLLRAVSNTCAAIMELEMYRAHSAAFAKLKAAIDGIVKTIDYFAEVIKTKYGGDPFDEDDAAEVYGGRARGARGGAVADYLPEIARSGLSFGEAISEFAYFYYVAKVRTNLDQTSKELDSYGEKYVDLLGDAVAARVIKLNADRKTILDRLTALLAAAPRAAPFDGAVPDSDARGAGAKKWINDEYDVKIKFYRAVQAIDLYMKVFTAAIAKDPDAVRDIKKMLEGTQVIARWFSEETGNCICKAFECMGSTNFGGAVVLNPVAGGALLARPALDLEAQSEHYYKQIEDAQNVAAPANKSRFGIPQLGVSPGEVDKKYDYAVLAKKHISDAMEHFQALKNLINAFARIGDKFGGRELRTQIFMSPTQIFKALTDYIKQSAMSINASAGDVATPPGDIQFDAMTLDTGAGVIPQIIDAVTPWRVFFGANVPSGGPNGANSVGNYEIEDKFFVIAIKAMAAKVMTTLGVYDMFERTSPVYDLTATRTVIGGADDYATDPEVLEGAAELYFRLPRLAEFYRSFLRWDGGAGAGGAAPNYKIAMLPELEGVFSGLIRLIFLKAVAPETGDYSDAELRALVQEVNTIYEHYRAIDSERVSQAAISAFVMEINRRYGIIKKEDMTKFMGMVKLTRTGNYGKLNNTNYAILPGEDEDEIERRAPSDRYMGPGAVAAAAANPYANRVGLDFTDPNNRGFGRKAMLRDFRNEFEKKLSLVSKTEFGKTSYTMLIKQAEREIRQANSRSMKFAIATKLIQNADGVGVDATKAFMFHETVVVGLNLLSSFESLLRNFSTAVDRMNPVTIENAIMDALYLNAINAVYVAPALVGGGNGTYDWLRAQMCTYVNDTALPGAVAPTTIYDRYIVQQNARDFAHRGRIELVAVPADVYTFLIAEEADYAAAGAAAILQGNTKPSDIKEEDPATNADIIAIDAANPLNADRVAMARYIRVLRVVARLLTNYGLIMRDYVESVFALVSGSKTNDASQALVEVRMTMSNSIGIQLGFAKLRGLIESLMGDVKFFFDIFRPSIPPDSVKRFESLANNGSVYWLEKNLVDVYLRGTDNDTNEEKTLSGLSRRATSVYNNLLRKTNVSLLGVTHAALIGAGPANRTPVLAPMAPPAANDTSRVETYGQTFSELVYYNAVDDMSSQTNIIVSPTVADWNALGQLIITSRPGAGGAGGAVLSAAGLPVPVGRFGIYTTDGAKGMTRYRSLLFAYNQLIANFLATLTDTAGGQRIYLNLINSYANGVASRTVTNPGTNSFPDLCDPAAANFGYRGDPKPDAVLCQSLAYIIQRLIKDVSPTTQVPDHLVTTLTDVPMYMKEAMRAHLPAFIKYFDLLAQKGDFIKQIIQKTAVNLDRPSQLVVALGVAGAPPPALGAKIHGHGAVNPVADFYPAGALSGLEELDGGKLSAAMKSKIASIVDAVSAGAFTLSSSASETLKELGDTPVYFQTQEGSIEQYTMRYEKMPMMPLSLVTYFLNDLEQGAALPGAPAAPPDAINDKKLFPGHVLGTAEFKLMYGTRQLVMRSTPVGFEQMPGAKAILDTYNGVSARREQIDESRFLAFAQSVVGSIRYITESRNIKSALSTVRTLFPFRSFEGGAANGLRYFTAAAGGVPATGNAAYSVNAPAANNIQNYVVNVLESSNQDEEISNIVSRVSGSGQSQMGARDKEHILNLIDMNIIPINVHALMRDVPLANMYNYEFTFEQMIASMFGEQSSRYTDNRGYLGRVLPYIDNANTANTRQMFLRLLVDPYLALDTRTYGSEVWGQGSAGFVHRIFRGDNNLGMGRPKFLSDQLFNKVLFGSVYQSERDYDEAGPSTGIGAARGQAAAVGPRMSSYRQLTIMLAEMARLFGNAAAAPGVPAGYQNAAVTGNAAGLAAAIAAAAAGGPPAQQVIRERVYDWLFTNIKPLPAKYRSILRAADRAFARVANYDPAALLCTPAVGGPGQNIANLFAVVENLGVTKAARIVNVGFDAACDGLMAEFRVGLGGSVPTLVNAQQAAAIAAADAEQLAARTGQSAFNPAVADAYVRGQQSGSRSAKLTYLATTDQDNVNGQVKTVTVGSDEKSKLEAIGLARFNTRFIRNIFFITNVVRMLRLKLNRELTQNRNVIVGSHMSVAMGITEYGSDPYSANEVSSSRNLEGLSRFNDQDNFV